MELGDSAHTSNDLPD